ncbi:MAG: hypothetical protein HOC23_14005 [Halieaceae bacterium]|jgi:hypothetical protein|nr:hypothetical protein [Halieaceae bacterium]
MKSEETSHILWLLVRCFINDVHQVLYNFGRWSAGHLLVFGQLIPGGPRNWLAILRRFNPFQEYVIPQLQRIDLITERTAPGYEALGLAV